MLYRDQISIVSNVARGGPQVDDRCGDRAPLGKGVNVCHDVMTDLLFMFGGGSEVNVMNGCFELGDLLVGDVEAKFLEDEIEFQAILLTELLDMLVSWRPIERHTRTYTIVSCKKLRVIFFFWQREVLNGWFLIFKGLIEATT